MSNPSDQEPQLRLQAAPSKPPGRIKMIWLSVLTHLGVWKDAWVADKIAAKDQVKRSREELEFLPAALEIQQSPPPPMGRAIAWTIMIFITLAVAWATFGTIDIMAVASGKLIPSGQVKVVQPLSSGTVKAIHVREGMRVEEGQVLVELDNTQVEAELERIAAELAVARMDVARTQALADNPLMPLEAFVPPSGAKAGLVAAHRDMLVASADAYAARLSAVQSTLEEREAQLEAVRANLGRMRETLPVVQREAAARKQLVDKGVAPKLSYGQYERQLIDYRSGITAEEKKAEALQASINAAQDQMNEIMSAQRNQTLNELALARRRVDSFEQEIVKLKRQSAEQVLTAPVDGIVQQLMVHTVGGVVSPAEHLMVIVPNTRELMAEVMIPNKDIGFVYAGQDAVIKLETFLFTRYGVIDGRVENVSPDAITDQNLGLVYAARVSLDKTSMMVDGREVRLSPGMAATVEVKIGKRRIIEFILSPLMRAAQESLRER